MSFSSDVHTDRSKHRFISLPAGSIDSGSDRCGDSLVDGKVFTVGAAHETLQDTSFTASHGGIAVNPTDYKVLAR